ncbi:hypothetical protein DYB31_006843 [Aphanomyces astaci]|uniref:Uncharacterized protein n=2 Tax=Aphanomyces astaci TaxID=112090 RepID=A0A397F4M5_APHAT|nr:hypothetical protein DYB31_006843 [Aphanomyces astaci]
MCDIVQISEVEETLGGTIMIVRAITTSTAAAERRTRLLKEAVRVQMISLAMSRGLTSVEAASHVDGTMMSTREQQRVSASLVDAPESEENQAPPSSNLIREIVGTDDVIDSTAVACRPRSSAESVELSLKPSHPPNPHQPEGLDGDASALQYTDQAAQELMHQELSALTATELRKIVQNHSAHHADAVDSRLERDSAAAVEVNALADSMSLNNQLDDDMIHRVKHLSMCQQQQLSAIVHKQSLLHVTTQVHYMVFISVFVIVSMHGRHDDSPYKMTLSLMDQLQDKPWPSRVTSVTKTFRDNVDCIDELYDYLHVSLVRLYVEAYPSGGMEPRGLFQTERLYAYSSSEDAVKLVGEALVLVAVTHQLYRMV